MTPDGQFPNVTKTPNPEVPESMDRAERAGPASRAPTSCSPPTRTPTASAAMAPDRDGRRLPLHHRQRDRRAADALQAEQAGAVRAAAGVADRRHDRGDDRPGHAHRPALRGARWSTTCSSASSTSPTCCGSWRATARYGDVRRHAGRLRHRHRGEPRHPGDAADPRQGRGGAALLLAELALDQKRQGRTVRRLPRRPGTGSSATSATRA